MFKFLKSACKACIKFFLIVVFCNNLGHTSMRIIYQELEEITRTRILAPNLSLKKFNDFHAPFLFDLTNRNRTHLKKWLPWLDYCTSESDSLEFIKKSNQDIRSNKALTYGMFDNEKLMGVISYHEINWLKKEAGIGYWIGEDFQSKGFVTIACKEMIKIGFEEVQLDRVLLSCATENVRSKSIPIRLNFKEGSVVKNKELLYDRYVDHVIYYMNKDYYNSKKNEDI